MTGEEYKLKQKKELIESVSSLDLDSLSFIGLDRSLTSTGVAVVRAGQYISGTEIKPKYFAVERLMYITNEILRVIRAEPNPIIITEDYAYGAQGQGILNLAELGGVVKFMLRIKKHKCFHVSPTLAKKYVAGQGNIKKEMIPLFVNRKFGVEAIIGHDHADAIVLAFLGYNAFRYRRDNVQKTLKDKECFDVFFALKKKVRKMSHGRKMALEIEG